MSANNSKIVLNNQIIEKLRSGSSEAVRALVEFGVRPDILIDEVQVGPTTLNSKALRKSAWFWSHQARKDDGVAAWWKLLDKQINATAPADRLPLLSLRFEEACQAGLGHSDIAPLAMTWGKMLSWQTQGGWSRQTMMAYLTRAVCELGDNSVPGLSSLSRAGLISPDDWTRAARRSYGSDPLTNAIENDHRHLICMMLDLGCDPLSQSGKPIISMAWARLREEISKTQIQIEGMNSSLIVVEALFNRNIDWGVPLLDDPERTVAEDAKDLVTLLSTKPYWQPMAHQIERRLLEETTPRGHPRKRSPQRI